MYVGCILDNIKRTFLGVYPENLMTLLIIALIFAIFNIYYIVL